MDMETQVKKKVETMLGTVHLLWLDPEEFDENTLDFAKRQGQSRLDTVTGAWIVSHFTGRHINFVQVQSPNKKLRYVVPAVREDMTFKEFITCEGWRRAH
jgi:hypothetical protein